MLGARWWWLRTNAADLAEEVHALREEVLLTRQQLQRCKQELLVVVQEKAEIVSVLADQLAGTASDARQQAALIDAQRKALSIRTQQVEEWESDVAAARQNLMVIEQHVKQGATVAPFATPACREVCAKGMHTAPPPPPPPAVGKTLDAALVDWPRSRNHAALPFPQQPQRRPPPPPLRHPLPRGSPARSSW